MNYAKRDIEGDDLRPHYMRHIDAMTREALHYKSAIAAELAYRDMQIGHLRQLLASSYSGAKLYCDDGCLQDNTERPFIDFRNDSVDDIVAKMMERGAKR
jgi:hypothetical protein